MRTRRHHGRTLQLSAALAKCMSMGSLVLLHMARKRRRFSCTRKHLNCLPSLHKGSMAAPSPTSGTIDLPLLANAYQIVVISNHF